MRTGASHLAAHVSLRNRNSSTLSPFCEEDDESFQYAILFCPAKAQPRLTHLSGVDDIGPDPPLWHSVPLLRGWLNISTLPAQAFLQPCCEFKPLLLLLSRGRTQIALDTLKLPSSALAF